MSRLRDELEDILYAWTLTGASYDRLIDELEDFVKDSYGPPF